MRYEKFVLFAIVIVLSMNFILADFETGNLSHSIKSSYGNSRPILGWINMSLTNEPADSLLTAFNSEITLINFLNENAVDYSCIPLDCEPTYALSGTRATEKTLTINNQREEILGINITGYVTSINKISFNITSNAGESCLLPLQIDILDDDSMEWQSDETIEEDCTMGNPFGCFSSSSNLLNITSRTLCERITLAPKRTFRIGAKVTGEGDAEFQISLDEQSHIETISSSGELSTIFEFEEPLVGDIEAEVCIKAQEGSENKYKVKYENTEPVCGFEGAEEENKLWDFEIFAKPQKYAGITEEFTFNQELLGEEAYNSLKNNILNYISTKYDNDCSEGCIIPFSFLSGTNQELTISNFALEYSIEADLNPITTNQFFTSEKTPNLLSTNFLKLDLLKANLLTPNSIGTQDLTLSLNNEEIFQEEIQIKRFPEVKAVLPKSPPALVSTTFFAIMENQTGNMTFTWDFGDNSSKIITTTNIVEHTYLNTGSYPITLTIEGTFGNSTEIFQVNAVAPSDAINQTIKDYRNNLKNIKIQIQGMHASIQKEFEDFIDTVSLEKAINKQEEEFKFALGEDEFLDIMKDLLALKVPKEITKEISINSTDYFQNPEQIKLENFVDIEAGEIDGDKEDYVNAMNNWIKDNLEATFQFKAYAFNYDNLPTESLFSYYKLTLKPEVSIDELYIIIDGNPIEIKLFNSEFREKDIGEIGKAVILKDLEEGETTIIEFIHPDRIDLTNLPIYLSPEFDDLDLSFIPSICNNNGKCDSGETTKNCRPDCKPWGLAIVFIIILIILALIIYIALQEWYKRRYESYLFKNKNDLFNLISFMSVSTSQGKTKEQIFAKLRTGKWKKEQIIYAWKKFKGKRTGMWEIPIFTAFEKIKLKKELKKRKPINQPPTPQRPFPPRNMPPQNRKPNKGNKGFKTKRF
jgi:hypothetical protein